MKYTVAPRTIRGFTDAQKEILGQVFSNAGIDSKEITEKLMKDAQLLSYRCDTTAIKTGRNRRYPGGMYKEPDVYKESYVSEDSKYLLNSVKWAVTKVIGDTPHGESPSFYKMSEVISTSIKNRFKEITLTATPEELRSLHLLTLALLVYSTTHFEISDNQNIEVSPLKHKIKLDDEVIKNSVKMLENVFPKETEKESLKG